MIRSYILWGVILVSILVGCTSETHTDEASAVTIPSGSTLNYGVLTTYPHDVTLFTEGLLMYKGKLYESTGSPSELQQTRSLIGVVNLANGKMEEKIELDRNKYFGEGIVFLNDKLYQLTYRTKIGFMYDATTFKQIGTFTFPSNEGWGFTTDSTALIMSDGSNKLTYLNPKSFKVEKVLSVTENGSPVTNLNELEFIHGFIYANVYTTNFIVKIDPGTGKVVGRLDFSSLAYDAKAKNPSALEMNGIAYDPTRNTVYITGKLWPVIYEVKINN
ncbi:glutaminyl-peptide cyclotransferase [Xanthocytophaga flava]|uniref:glutaminyl-peptide cyclotransferase n=1 Tax=Xanthocytophaga flava TaxID=3048013 RepID=UPI0028D6F78C|nr:glutaminyl-peptide cyclotransferase [Xanthocytophaga flavus]MDJ1466241.1 glutaminyl-peptide cyclotransferase [Xanthocytophaga flavus]